MLFKNIGLIDENFEYQPNMYVGVMCSRIAYVSSEPPEDMGAFGDVYDGAGKLLMPGFYNAHAHSPMTLMRGYGENLPLHRWLNELIFPFEAKLYGDAVYWGQMLAMAESARYGIVSTSDMYMLCDDMVKAVVKSGMKANVAQNMVNIGVPMSEHPMLKAQEELILMYHGFEDNRILTSACVHAEYTNTDETVDAITELAKKYDVDVQVHVSETEFEVNGCKERHDGMSPVKYLAKHGLFDNGATAAHCVWLDDEDRDILKEYNVTVASNPISNLKLVSGMCDVPKLYEKGINVAIGTDSVSSNNSLNFFEELKMFALIGKMKGNDAALMTPQQVLYSATRAGALAQGRKDCGIIKVGYRADMIVVDTTAPNMQPIHNIMNNLVYSADGKDVLMTIVDGRIVYQDGEYPTIDVEKAASETDAARKKILESL